MTTTTTPTAYPLTWPAGWPRTAVKERARFDQTLPSALNRLKKEISLLGGKSLVLSSNYTLGADRVTDSGVVAYFILGVKQIAIPCDRWHSVEDNVQAIALTVGAMRGMERWGAKNMIEAMFQGFRSLPQKASGVDPWELLGIARSATEEQVTAAYRDKAKTRHPDVQGGSAEAFAEIREAHDIIMQSVRRKP